MKLPSSALVVLVGSVCGLLCGLLAVGGCATNAAPAKNGDLQPALITTPNGTLSEPQVLQIKDAIMSLSAGKPVGGVNKNAFTVTDRLTIGPRGLPAGAVTQHLESVFLLKTDGQRCFIVLEGIDEKTGEQVALPGLACSPK